MVDFQKVRDFIKGSKIKEALDYLCNSSDDDTEVILLQSRYNTNEINKSIGEINDEDYRVEKRKISSATIALVTELMNNSENKTHYTDYQKLKDYYRSLFTEKKTAFDDTKLEDVYVKQNFSVHPDFVIYSTKGSFSQNFSASENYGINHTFITYFKKWITDNEFRKQNNLQKSRQRLVVLEGSPGQGKTSLCYKLLHDLVQEDFPIEVHYIPLKDIEQPQSLISDFWTPISAYFREKRGYKLKDNPTGLFILDGLDELMLLNSSVELNLPDFFNQLDLETRKEEQLSIIVTCRLGLIDYSYLNSSNAIVFKVDDFTSEQQDLWLEKRLRINTEMSLTKEKLAQYRSIKDNGLADLLGQPILLQLISELSDFPEYNLNKGFIYSEIYNKLINSEWKTEQNKHTLKLNKKRFWKALCHLAYKMSGSKSQKTILEAEIDSNFSNSYFPDLTSESLISILVSNFYLEKLASADGDRAVQVQFIHNSIREYLTAEFLYSQLSEFLSNPEDTDHKALSDFFNNLFTPLGLQPEICKMLCEITSNKCQLNTHEHKIIVDKIARILPNLYDYDFGFSNSTLKKHPIDHYLNNWMYFWTYYSYLSNNLEPLRKTSTERLNSLIDYASRKRRVPLKFTGMNLPKLIIKGGHAEQFDFSMSILKDANFSATDLSEAIFCGADLSNAIFDGAILHKADFKYLQKTNNTKFEDDKDVDNEIEVEEFNTNIKNSSFKYATLKEVNFEGANLQGADFTQADLSEAIFNDADISGVIFCNADLRLAKFDGSVSLVDADLHGAKVNSSNWFNEHLIDLEHVNDLQEKYTITKPPLDKSGDTDYYVILEMSEKPPSSST